jgi:hypothetical protein
VNIFLQMVQNHSFCFLQFVTLHASEMLFWKEVTERSYGESGSLQLSQKVEPFARIASSFASPRGGQRPVAKFRVFVVRIVQELPKVIRNCIQ